MQQVDLFKVDVQQLTYLHDEQQHEGSGQTRQTDVDDLLPAVRAVDLRRFVQAAVNARQRGDVDHSLPAHRLPEAGDHVDGDEILRYAQIIDRRAAHHLGELRQRADAGGQDGGNHGDQHHRRNEVRQVGNGLHELHEFRAAKLVEHQREEHRHGEEDDQGGQVQLQRVADIVHQVGIRKQALEVLPAHKLGIKALEQLVIIKRAAQKPHGHILQQDKIHDHREDHQVNIPVAI